MIYNSLFILQEKIPFLKKVSSETIFGIFMLFLGSYFLFIDISLPWFILSLWSIITIFFSIKNKGEYLYEKRQKNLLGCFLVDKEISYVICNKNLSITFFLDNITFFNKKIPKTVHDIPVFLNCNKRLSQIFLSLQEKNEFFSFEQDFRIENNSFIRVKGLPKIINNELLYIIEISKIKYSQYGGRGFIKNLLDQTELCIAIISEKKRFKYINITFCDMFDTNESIIGKNFDEIGLFFQKSDNDKNSFITKSLKNEDKNFLWSQIGRVGDDVLYLIKNTELDTSLEELQENSPFSAAIINEKVNIIYENKKWKESIFPTSSRKHNKNFLDFIQDKDKNFFISELKSCNNKNIKEIKLTLNNGIEYKVLIIEKNFFQKKLFFLYLYNNSELYTTKQHVLHLQRLVYLGQLTVQVLHDVTNNLTAALGFCDVLGTKIGDGINKQKIKIKEISDEYPINLPQKLTKENISEEIHKIIIDIIENILKEQFRDEDSNSDYFFLSKIKHSICRASNLCRKLLCSARKETISKYVQDINSSVSDLLYTIGRLMGEKIKIRFLRGQDIPPLQIDETNFEQIAINILLNGRDSMLNGGEILITTSLFDVNDETSKKEKVTMGQYVCLSIKDSGTGIPSDDIEKIFDSFFTTKKDNGTGMGLYIVKSIIKDSGGFINVVSEKNKGSDFKIFLKVNTGNEVINFVTSKDNGPLGSKELLKKQKNFSIKKTILFVDDEIAIQEVAKKGIEPYGFNVIIAGSSKDLIEEIKKENITAFDILITDMTLVGEDGQDVISVVEKNFSNISFPVIITSGYSFSEAKFSSFKNQNCFFLSKPFSIKDLLELLESIFESNNK
jgi:signal transduction histidine kinase/CheY-like chemotaxis protein